MNKNFMVKFCALYLGVVFSSVFLSAESRPVFRAHHFEFKNRFGESASIYIQFNKDGIPDLMWWGFAGVEQSREPFFKLNLNDLVIDKRQHVYNIAGGAFSINEHARRGPKQRGEYKDISLNCFYIAHAPWRYPHFEHKGHVTGDRLRDRGIGGRFQSSGWDLAYVGTHSQPDPTEMLGGNRLRCLVIWKNKNAFVHSNYNRYRRDFVFGLGHVSGVSSGISPLARALKFKLEEVELLQTVEADQSEQAFKIADSQGKQHSVLKQKAESSYDVYKVDGLPFYSLWANGRPSRSDIGIEESTFDRVRQTVFYSPCDVNIGPSNP